MDSEQLQKQLHTLYSLPSKEEAQDFLAGLPPLEARLVVLRADMQKISWLRPGDKQGLDVPFRDMEAGTSTVEQAHALYLSLKSLVTSAKRKADEEGKPLHIIVGEVHTDRSGLLASFLLMRIAKDLGIEQLGVELFPSGNVKSTNGMNVLGFEEIQANIDKRSQLPEEYDDGHSTMPNAKRKNCQFQMFLAKSIGMDCFANDPNGIVGYKPKASHEDIFANREGLMAEKLQELADEGVSAMSVYGVFHLEGLRGKLPENAHTLVIDNVNLCLLYEYRPSTQEVSANARVLPASGRDAAELAHSGDAIFVKTPGDMLQTARQAWELAQAVFRRQERGPLAERGAGEPIGARM